MATRVIMPYMGLTTVEGTILEWLVHEGDTVAKGHPLVEVLTDKVSTQVEAPESGTLLRIVAAKDTVVQVTEPLCWIGQAGETIPGFDQPDRQEPASSAIPSPTSKEDRQTAPGAYVKASPVARRLARERGIDLTEFAGTGPGGRVVEGDVRNLGEREQVPREPEPTGAADHTPTTVERHVAPAPAGRCHPSFGTRRSTARRMADRARTVASVTLTTEVDVTEMAMIRSGLATDSEGGRGVDISDTDILVKAVAQALRRHPKMNARLAEMRIELLDEVNVGIAVDGPGGLAVPVIHNADRKDLPTIARERRQKVGRAATGSLKAEDVGGGTFTVTVDSPSWIDTSYIEAIVGGQVVETISPPTPIGEGTSNLYESVFEIDAPSGPSWVIFHARGDGDLAPLHPGDNAFAVSNPYYLE